ncbi:sensor histidine kinase [Aneurinibacillus aneurinilyticus]|uniref:sensor histidine kinase n=1 Tax=Aneurinibacillus aneurinilyticus TaxID=1391 RepID=UPI003524BEC7
MRALKKWSNLPIRLKFFSVFLTLVLLAGSGMFVLNHQLFQVARDNDKIINHSVPNLTTQLQIKSTIMERINYVMLYVTTGDEELHKKFIEASKRAKNIEDQLKKNALPHEKEGIEQFIIHSEDWEGILSNEVIPVYQRNNPKDALATLNSRAQPLAIELMNEAEELSQQKIHEISSDNKKVLNNAWSSVQAGYIVMGGTLLLALLFSYYISHSITNPIFSLLDGVRRMTKGDFTTQVAMKRQDEWGELSKAFNRMSQSIANLVEELKQANARLREESHRARESTRLKSEFLANMSHEVRTPLTGIIGFAELLHEDAEEKLSPVQKNFTRNIIKAGEHLLTMINDILDLSKIEAGKYELEMSRFDMVELVRNTLVMMEAKAEKQNISLVIETKHPILQVVADKTRIRQILLNLIGNAIKFSHSHSVVRVMIEQSEHTVIVRVADEGIGIETEKWEAVFDPFYQNDGRLDRKYEGTGLGLALSRQLIELHGGTIGVESKLGKGSVFSFYLPSAMKEVVTSHVCEQTYKKDPLLVLYTVDFLDSFQDFSEKIQKGNRPFLAFMIESKREAIEIAQKHPGYDILVAVQSFQAGYVDILERLSEHTQGKIFSYIKGPLRFVERGQVMRVAEYISPSSDDVPTIFSKTT